MTTLNSQTRATARVRLNRVNQIVNLICKRETARVDFFEASAELDNLLPGISPQLAAFAKSLSEAYQVSTIDVPQPKPVKETAAPRVPPTPSKDEIEAKKSPKHRKKSEKQLLKSKERLAKLREAKRQMKALKNKDRSEAETESSEEEEVIPESSEEEKEVEIPEPIKEAELVVSSAERAAKDKKRKSFNKKTGLQIGDQEDILRDDEALSDQISKKPKLGLARNKSKLFNKE